MKERKFKPLRDLASEVVDGYIGWDDAARELAKRVIDSCDSGPEPRKDGTLPYQLLPLEEEVKVGEKVLFHSRMIYIGIVVRVTEKYIVINNAGWLAEMAIPMSRLMREGVPPKAEWEPFLPSMELRIPLDFVHIPWEHEIPQHQLPKRTETT